jgi:metallo-beta-lactamase family protein
MYKLSDCSYVNKKEQRKGQACTRPLYNTDDVRKLVRRFEGTRYGDTLKIAPRVTASFHDAGHILGSAAILVKYTVRGNTTTVLFSGDLSRSNMPILRDHEPPRPCDVLVLESTYGGRLHEINRETMKQKTLNLLTHAKTHKSKIVVLAFAVGWTQELVMRIKELVGEGRLDPIPIYIDSPLASRATEVFRRHSGCYDEETTRTFTSSGDLFAGRQYAPEWHEGPLRHHLHLGHVRRRPRRVSSLKHAIQDEASVIVFVGFQSEHTLGRKLVEGWDVLPIFGVPTPRRAQIVTFNGLSAHADRQDLLAYVRVIIPAPDKIFLVHGEEKQALSLAAAIQAEHSQIEVTVPHVGASHEA